MHNTVITEPIRCLQLAATKLTNATVAATAIVRWLQQRLRDFLHLRHHILNAVLRWRLFLYTSMSIDRHWTYCTIINHCHCPIFISPKKRKYDSIGTKLSSIINIVHWMKRTFRTPSCIVWKIIEVLVAWVGSLCRTRCRTRLCRFWKCISSKRRLLSITQQL